ncbi:AAA family ATPase [Marinobacterium sp. D7]|uniref:ExeA family protein n=1 Tax=Marinobacterium ramblicola TaxID=2849041 RepID=UPI001C2CD28F|nr:ExeA family protein [Marinobacterium ramblicola]MBV1787968.1 AAA family ATPase [Marinobacterium ramblicola]
MYCNYFGLSESPFSIAPNPRYLFMSEQHQEALAHLLYGIKIDGGFVLLTGEVGTGKTTVARQLLEHLPEHTDVAVILNPRQSVIELLQSICDELQLPAVQTGSVKQLVDHIQQELLRRYAEGRNTVLLIDEAQQLSVDLLEQIRLLTNLETSEHKLLNIILLGQPELLELLAREDLRQLSQRITARYHLGPLSMKELPLYIRHRLSVAGLNRPVFPEPVLKQLFHLSGGLPRLINLISDRALLGAYVQKQNEVSPATLKQAAKEVLGDQVPLSMPSRTSKRMILTAALLAGLLAWGTGFLLSVLYKEGGGAWFERVTSVFNTPVQADTSPSADIRKPERPIVVRPVQQAAVTVLQEAALVQPDAIALTANTAPDPALLGSNDKQPVEQPPVVQPIADDKPVLQHWNWKVQEDRDLAEVLAYRRLFEAWGVDYDPRQQPVVCDYAESQGLACLSLDGTSRLLEKLDRPAVTELKRDGVGFQVLVLSLSDQSAQIYSDGTEFTIARELLDSAWPGRFALLWRPPPDYSTPLWPGASGDSVAWLEQHLARAEGRVLTQPQRKQYDAGMVEQVRSFQRSKGLDIDGVAGPRTLILLNSTTEDDLPRLSGPRS